MKLLTSYSKISLALFAGALAGVGYLLLSQYEDIKLSLTQKPPRALLADAGNTLKCELPDGENHNKLMFVSCSGFYDE